MKYLIYIRVLLFSPLLLFASNDKQERLEIAIKEIVEYYNSKNDTLLNRYINPENGIYFILKANNNKYWLHRSQICLKKECINKFNLSNPYSQILLEQKLDTTFNIQYQQVNLAADTETGILVDEVDLHILTKTIRNLKQKDEFIISNEELRRIWKIETNSKRICVAKNGDVFGKGKFTFYLSYLNNNWYLSTIYFNN